MLVNIFESDEKWHTNVREIIHLISEDDRYSTERCYVIKSYLNNKQKIYNKTSNKRGNKYA